MSRLFDDASSEYLIYSGGIVTDPPFTMACWVNIDAALTYQIAMGLGDSDSASWVGHWLLIQSNKLWAESQDGATYYYAQSAAGIGTGTWVYLCGVWAATDDRRSYVNGGTKGTNSDDLTVSGVENATIGCRYTKSGEASVFFSGMVAEAAIWNVALTDAEVAVLADAYSPLCVRPASLAAYYPLVRDTDDDVVGGYSMTAVNTPSVGAHPRVLRAAVPLCCPPAGAGGAPAGQPMQLRGVHVPHIGRRWQGRAFA